MKVGISTKSASTTHSSQDPSQKQRNEKFCSKRRAGLSSRKGKKEAEALKLLTFVEFVVIAHKQNAKHKQLISIP